MYVAVNAAISADGKLSNRRREQIAISSEADFERVDDLRASSDAVMVGVGTVVADDPRLGIGSRDNRGAQQAEPERTRPARVVADSTARIPPDARILDDTAPTYLLVTEAAPEERLERLRSGGTEIIRAGEEEVDLSAAFAVLETHGISELLVEGGGEILFSLFDSSLVDELTVYIGSILIGGRDAPTLIDGAGWTTDFPSLTLEDVRRLDDGVVLRYTVD